MAENRKIKNLLWATDFSKESRFCLPYIKFFNQLITVKNYALYVLPKFSDWVYEAAFFSNEDLFREIEKTKKKSLVKIKEFGQSKQLDFKAVVLEGVASEEIIHFSNSKKIDMIFAGRRGISELEQLLVGSTTSRLIRNSDLPVFIVPKNKPRARIKKILTPVDFNSQWLSELRYSISLSKELSAKLYIAHVSEFFNYRVPVLEKDKLTMVVSEKISEVAKEHHFNIEGFFYDIGEAAHKIIEISKREKMDLIVMTSHQRKGFEKFFLGSVTEKVLMATDIPLLILPFSLNSAQK
jgi:nucleotide-binding universal stress UspA family protein